MYNLIREKEADMILAIVILFLVLTGIFMAKLLPAKFFGILFFLITVCITVGICIAKPVMHKPFSINVIEYLIKINDDGSITTTKQTTTTVLEDKSEK